MTKEEAIVKYNLDRRHKWYVFSGTICKTVKETMPCCKNGCDECGYTKKFRTSFPMPFINPKTGNPLEVEGVDFT